MKYYVYGALLLLGIGLSVNADSIRIAHGTRMVGIIGVGDNRGTACAITLSKATADIYSDRQSVTFAQFKRNQGKWVAVSESFSMQDYSGQFFGSKQKVDSKGTQKKLTITIFKDPRSQAYKAIVHEGNLASDGSVGKYTVCENMVIK